MTINSNNSLNKKHVSVYNYSETSRKVKAENQDCAISFYDESISSGLILVCDGLGGYIGAQEAAGTVANQFNTDLNVEFLTKLKTIDTAVIFNFVCNYVTEILVKARERLKQLHSEENAKRTANSKTIIPSTHPICGFCTTISFCILSGNMVYYSWVGDSRVYLIRKGRVKCLTVDHSEGVNPEDFNELEMLLTGKKMSKSISPFADDEFITIDINEIHSIELEDGDVILCASDGIFDYLLPWILESVLVKTLAFGFSVEEYVKKVFYQIRPVFQDDTTLSLAFYGEPEPFGKFFPVIDDAFFELNACNFNKKINDEFDRFPYQWDKVRVKEDWEEYKKRKPWNEILFSDRDINSEIQSPNKLNITRLTNIEQIIEKVMCKKCKKSFLQSEAANLTCPECNTAVYSGPFLEIYYRNNVTFDNPYEKIVFPLERQYQSNNHRRFLIDREGKDAPGGFFLKDIPVSIAIDNYKKEKWEINEYEHSRGVKFYWYFPASKNEFKIPFDLISEMKVGDSSYYFEKENGKLYFEGERIKPGKEYYYGKEFPKAGKEYIELTGEYLGYYSGKIIYNENGKIAFSYENFENGLFFYLGANFFSHPGYPKNAILRIDKYYIALRGNEILE